VFWGIEFPGRPRLPVGIGSVTFPELAGDTIYADYMIAGGGTAGPVVAARLSQDPGPTVALSEAGASTTPRSR
jgi:hypothetical protein